MTWVNLQYTVIDFVFHLFTTTYYTIDGSSLKIKSIFLVNKKIDINKIKKILETNTPLSAPAESLDRLEIIYVESGSMSIST